MIYIVHGEVMVMETYYWPLLGGVHRWPVEFHRSPMDANGRSVMQSFGDVFVVSCWTNSRILVTWDSLTLTVNTWLRYFLVFLSLSRKLLPWLTSYLATVSWIGNKANTNWRTFRSPHFICGWEIELPNLHISDCIGQLHAISLSLWTCSFWWIYNGLAPPRLQRHLANLYSWHFF